MKNLFFWAQSLDNQSPDLIFKGREKIVNESTCQQIVSEIYELPGEKIKLSSDITVRFRDPKFVIEAIPIEKDEGNRLAPIVIYGEIPEKLSSDWIESSCNTIREVVTHKLNRTLNPDAVTKIQEWLTSRWDGKKKKIETQKQMIEFGTVFVIPLILVSSLQATGIQLNPLQIGVLMIVNNVLVRILPNVLNSQKIRTR